MGGSNRGGPAEKFGSNIPLFDFLLIRETFLLGGGGGGRGGSCGLCVGNICRRNLPGRKLEGFAYITHSIRACVVGML